MMDSDLVLSAAQPITATAVSTNVINGRTGGSAICEPLYFVVRVNAAITGPGTVDFQLQTSDAEGFGTSNVLFDSGPIAAAQLGVGYPFMGVQVPFGAKQYLRGNYVVTSGPMTGGSVDAYLVDAVTFQQIFGINSAWN